MPSYQGQKTTDELGSQFDVERLVAHPQLYGLWQFWDKMRGGRVMPARIDFTPELLKPWLGNLALIDVCQNPTRLQYRLVGTRIVDNSKFDATGKFVDELIGNPLENPLGRGLVRCFLLKSPVFEIVRPPRTGVLTLDYYRLALPLSANGCDVNMIMLGEYVTSLPLMIDTSPRRLAPGHKAWL